MERKKKRLTAKQFELLRPRYQGVREENVIGMLLDHIDVTEEEIVELKAFANRVAEIAPREKMPWFDEIDYAMYDMGIEARELIAKLAN